MITLTFKTYLDKKKASRFLIKYQVPAENWNATSSEPTIEVTSSLFPRIKRIFDRDKIEYWVEERS